MQSPHVLVIGAGLGGLALTLALQKAGIPVSVYEQAPEMSEVGAGIMLTPNASRSLRYAGVLDAVAAKALRPGATRVKNWKTGETLSQVTYDDAFNERYKLPFQTIHRADLQQALIDGVLANDPAVVNLNHQIVDVRQNANEVEAIFANGATAKSDLLVACDGVRSIVRTKLLNPEPPRFTGNVAWRGMAPSSAFPPEARTNDTATFVGPRRHVVRYEVNQGANVNFVAIAERDAWTEEGWNVPAKVDELYSTFDGWHGDVQALFANTPSDRLYKWGLFDHNPLPRWTEGRVTLLGDAAHPMLPLLAQGAAMSMEDGVVLARSIAETDTVADALATYEAARRERTAWVQLRARFFAEMFHREASQEELRGERNESNNFLYPYDAATVPLR